MVDITKGEKSKERIIECAAELFLKNGYNNTGIKEILKETQLPKGSFYYHFKSKKDLAIAVADYYKSKIGRWILRISKDKTWTEFIDKLIDDIIIDAEKGEYYGCPFATLGSEMAFIDPDIVQSYSSPMMNLISVFSRVLEFSNISKEKVEYIAKEAFALFEGYVMYYRVTKDIKILETLRQQLKSIY